MLNLIVNTADPNQNGLLNAFNSPGMGIEQDFIKGDRKLALDHRPVVPTGLNSPPWQDDWLDTDTYQIEIGNPDVPPTSGSALLGVQRKLTKTITNVSVATSSEVTTSAAHGMTTGDVAFITGTTGVTPDINLGYYVVTVTGATTFTIPVNVTVGGGTGGTLTSFNTNGLTTLAWNISAATLQTALSATSATEGYGNVTASLFNPGNYEIKWNTAGTVPALYANGALLLPVSSAVVTQVTAGDALTQAVQTLEFEQQPVAFCTPSTPFPPAAINTSITQAGAAGPPAVDKIYAVALTAGTYGGTFYISVTAIDSTTTAFIASGDVTGADLQAQLNTAGGITSGDIAVTRVNDTFNIQFQGTQKGSNAPVIAATNIDLIAPLGVSGQMDLNTVNLYVAFAQTTAQTLSYTFAIRRDRASGESAEYFQKTVTLKRNLIQGPLVPLQLPTYYTAAQIDAIIASIKDGSGNILVGTKFRIAPTANGAIFEASTDGSTWQNAMSIIAS